MKKELSISDSRFPVEHLESEARPPRIANGFTLIEVMVVMGLLSLIVLALMAVFNATQTAFRASVTQSDILEGGRAAMDLMTGDLRGMAPSLGANSGAMNFCVTNYGYPPVYQSLAPISPNTRTNVQENFFILSRGNKNGVPTWFGRGYAVYSSPTNLYSLYHFSTDHPVGSSGAPDDLFYMDFSNFLASPNSHGGHLVDGVVGLRLQAFDLNGALINTNAPASLMRTNSLPNLPGEAGYVFYGNALPASVEIEMATVEDRTLQQAEVKGVGWLTNQVGKVHVFRQRVSIPNVDPAAYQ